MIPTEEMGQEALRLLAAVNSDPLVTEAVRKVVDGLEQDIGSTSSRGRSGPPPST